MINPYPFQAEALTAVEAAGGRWPASPGPRLATGLGKTVAFTHIFARRPGHALVLARRCVPPTSRRHDGREGFPSGSTSSGVRRVQRVTAAGKRRCGLPARRRGPLHGLEVTKDAP